MSDLLDHHDATSYGRSNSVGLCWNVGWSRALFSKHPTAVLFAGGLLNLPVCCCWRAEADIPAPLLNAFHGDNALLFQEEGVFNYSTMLLREDLGLLVLGAREAVFALDLANISNKNSSVEWKVTEKQVSKCRGKGKDPENYIRALHMLKDGRMYVCGTNAFDPECDYLSFENGELTLKKTGQDGKGKCPFDPFQKYASVMLDDELYSATSMNFLGSEPILMRSSGDASIRTEFKSSWLNEPKFVSMAWVPESVQSATGDDDKVYLFFTETAVEFDCYNKLVVPRVARVCKGDLGGLRTLQKKWTSFLKTEINCPVLNSPLPLLIQDSYLWCDYNLSWKECIFFAIFTPQSETSDVSAVCAYNMSDISRVFSEGKYKTSVNVETSFVKWVMYSGEVPVPRPGACINNEARSMRITKSLDLPDRTLQFVKDRPLLDQAVEPVSGEPLLMRRGAAFTRIIVNQVQAADGRKYHVMFIGTEKGTILKAVNYDGEMFIIEEIHIFQTPQLINILAFSTATGQIYAGSDQGAAQIPLANCERSLSCIDCVLARDPYCGWDAAGAAYPIKVVSLSVRVGGKLELSCPPPSSLTNVRWERGKSVLTSSPRQQILLDKLLILNATAGDAGHYCCSSVERSKAGEFTTTVTEYQVSIDPADPNVCDRSVTPKPQTNGPSVAGLHAVIALLVIALAALSAWTFCKRYRPQFSNCTNRSEQTQEAVGHQNAARPAMAEAKPLVSEPQNSCRNNNAV
uniref:Semaphorin 4e n=1 Tax=Nothobranchius furzeri TaxID=105023 RepID=A0A8C6MG83_NOTFU